MEPVEEETELAANRKVARRLAAEAIGRGQPLEWFETLYHQAAGHEAGIPWADMTVNPTLARWLTLSPPSDAWTNALVIGCGLGDDAEAQLRSARTAEQEAPADSSGRDRA